MITKQLYHVFMNIAALLTLCDSSYCQLRLSSSPLLMWRYYLQVFGTLVTEMPERQLRFMLEQIVIGVVLRQN